MHPDQENQEQENQEQDNDHQEKVERSMNLIDKILNFLERLKNKQQSLEHFIEEGSELHTEIVKFLESLGDEMEEWYFWKFITESQPTFFNMELDEIFYLLDEDNVWPHHVIAQPIQ